MQEQPSQVGLQPGQGFALLGTAIGAMAIFVLPLLLGPVGMACGGIAYFRGERRGRWVVVIGAVGLVLGVLLGLLPDKFVSN